MKNLVKLLLVGSAMAIAPITHAAMVTISINDDYAAGEADFLNLLNSTVAFEDFNSLGGAQVLGPDDQTSWENKASAFDTQVGLFTLTSPGWGGDDNPHNDELMIESDLTGEFGRQVMLRDPGDFWLDSNDAREVVWDFTKPAGGNFNAVGFTLADAADVSANLTLQFSDGTYETILFPQSNGNLKFVSITSDENILGGSLSFINSTTNDGWGIDNVTLGHLPEPGTLLLMGLGLLGLGAARRRLAK